MDVATLVADIRDETNKPSLSEGRILSKLQSALRVLEMKDDWQYMRKVLDFSLNPANPNPRRIAQPARIKKIEFLRYVRSDAGFRNIRSVDPNDVIAVAAGEPNGYYKSGYDYLIVDNTPDRVINGEIYAVQYTAWTGLTTSCWMIDTAFPVLFYETLIQLGPYLREPELMRLWSELRQDALQTALVANEEYEYADQRLYMEFSDGRED